LTCDSSGDTIPTPNFSEYKCLSVGRTLQLVAHVVDPCLSKFGEYSETKGESGIPKESEDARGGTCGCGHEVALAEPRERWRARLKDEAIRGKTRRKSTQNNGGKPWGTRGPPLHEAARVFISMSGSHLRSRLLVLNVLENGHAPTRGGMERQNASLSGMIARLLSFGAGRVGRGGLSCRTSGRRGC